MAKLHKTPHFRRFCGFCRDFGLDSVASATHTDFVGFRRYRPGFPAEQAARYNRGPIIPGAEQRPASVPGEIPRFRVQNSGFQMSRRARKMHGCGRNHRSGCGQVKIVIPVINTVIAGNGDFVKVTATFLHRAADCTAASFDVYHPVPRCAVSQSGAKSKTAKTDKESRTEIQMLLRLLFYLYADGVICSAAD